jgi:CRP/FNR family transcriptional regulator, nitrogen oxide reductase regulator
MDRATQAILTACPLFAGIDRDALDVVAARGVERRLTRGAVLFVEGDEADAFYVVMSGRLKLTQTGAEGQQVIVRYVGAGEMCAVVALTPGDNYPVGAEAVEPTTVVLWPRERLRELVIAHPLIALNAVRLLSDRMREVTARLRELATEKVARRVARALLRLARKTGKRVEGGVLLDLPLSREDLAAMTGTTLFTVSRLLAEWEREGIVETGRERVVIRRPHGLVAIAEDLPKGG